MFPTKFALLMIAGALAFISESPALAAEFSGPHIEGVIGWSHPDGDSSLFRGHEDGFVYGGGGGYDLRLGKVVVGILGEISDVTGKHCGQLDLDGASDFGPPAVSGRVCGHDGRAIFGGARVGYVVGSRSLLYIDGGYANARFSSRFDGTENGTPTRFSGHYDLDGVRVGAGLEQAVGRHAFVKAEYRYTAVGHALNTGQHQIVTGIGYRF